MKESVEKNTHMPNSMARLYFLMPTFTLLQFAHAFKMRYSAWRSKTLSCAFNHGYTFCGGMSFLLILCSSIYLCNFFAINVVDQDG
jgi:hypothetical protein